MNLTKIKKHLKLNAFFVAKKLKNAKLPTKY